MKSGKLDLEERRFLRKLGSQIRAIRIERDWTLEETEEHGWPSWQHLQKIESGKNITAVTLRRICVLYRISLSELFRGL